MSVEQGWPGLAQYTPAVPADWTPLPRTVQDALDQLGGRAPGLSTESSFVYRPGGVSAPGVYVTSAQLLAAVDAEDTASNKVVSVDNSLGAAHIGSGPWPDNITWQSGGGTTLATLIVDIGTTFGGKTYRFRNIIVQNAATAPVITVALGDSASLNFEAAGMVPAGAGNVFADVAGVMQMRTSLSTIGDGTNPLFAVEATGTIVGEFVNGSIFLANTIKQGALPGGAVTILCDGASQANGISATQVPAPSITVFDPLPTFVFQPGGTAGGNVFTSWPLLMAAANQTPGPKTIGVNDNLAPAHVTTVAGGTPWNLDQVSLTSAENTTGGGAAKLIFDDGSKVTFGVLRVGFILLQNAAASPVFTTTNPEHRIYLTEGAGFMNSGFAGASEWSDIATGTTLFLSVLQGSQFGDGVHAVVKLLAAGSTLLVRLRDLGCTFAANAVSGGVGTFSASVADDATMSATQAPVPVITFSGKASQLAYTAGTGGNWNPVPTLTNAALDQLAAQNTTQASNNTGTGTGAVSVQTGNLTKAKSGLVLVIATLAGTTSAGTTVTGQLVRDAATNIGTAVVATTLSVNDGFELTMAFVDTLPDNAAHTYKITGTAGAGNITAGGANSFQITAVEL